MHIVTDKGVWEGVQVQRNDWPPETEADQWVGYGVHRPQPDWQAAHPVRLMKTI